eukprot:scaffold230724_cov17-Tisochrysis_lutea.AAC.1
MHSSSTSRPRVEGTVWNPDHTYTHTHLQQCQRAEYTAAPAQTLRDLACSLAQDGPPTAGGCCM